MDDKHRSFLVEHGALDVQHTGRAFFEHLKGVHDLLRDWGNDEEVCLAGLYHSIYGTNTFKHQTLTDRGELARQIGVRAEALVYYFKIANRPFFDEILEPQRTELREIEAANLIEQHAGSIKTLRKLSMMKLSSGAKAALIMEVALR